MTVLTDRFVIALTFVILIVLHEIRKIVWPPSNFPKTLPTIPFYVCFITLFTDWDQEKIYNVYYRQKLEKHGAVKVYFASRWNILVTRPEYLVQIFKNNEVFEKSGNHEKIPYSVLAEYTGDNVISAGNRNWKKYRDVITQSILIPNLQPLEENVRDFITQLKLAPKNSAIASYIQKLTLANIGDCIIGVDLHSNNDENSIHDQIQRVKQQIFKPIYMNFPFLDKLPIPSRVRARNTVRVFKEQYCAKIEREITPENLTRLGPVLSEAFHAAEITEKQFQDNAVIALVAGHENPQLLITSLLYVLAKYEHVQQRLREELSKLQLEEKDQCVLLNQIVYETLRMYPPLGHIINRRTNCKVILGENIVIPKGVYVGYNNFGTQRDPKYWKKADLFRPERWGETSAEMLRLYSSAKSKCILPAFHGRNRACLGEKFALAQVRKVVIGVVESFEFALDPKWTEKLTPAGPICPANLKLVTKEILSLD